MKLKLVQLEKISESDTFYIIGGQIKPNKKAKREQRKSERKKRKANRKAMRRLGSDSSDTLKNDTF